MVLAPVRALYKWRTAHLSTTRSMSTKSADLVTRGEHGQLPYNAALHNLLFMHLAGLTSAVQAPSASCATKLRSCRTCTTHGLYRCVPSTGIGAAHPHGWASKLIRTDAIFAVYEAAARLNSLVVGP